MRFDPHSTAIEELMKHLDKSDDDDLGVAMKPKADGVEMTKIGVTGDSDMDGDKDMSGGTPDMGDGGPKLSDDEIQELIEALQSKLGSGANGG